MKLRIYTELVAMFAAGKLCPPVAAAFDLEQGVEALKMLAERRAVGKVIVRC